MRSAGNGNPEVCVQNIVDITKGEVPYLRAMGIDGDLFDKPITEVEGILMADAEEQIETYEPRVQINSVEAITTQGGHIEIHPDITITE